MSARFEISPTVESFCQFHFIDSQGDTVLLSGEYESRDLAEKAIQDVRVSSLISQQIAKGITPAGEMFFVIKNNGGQVIAKSVLYDNEMRFDNALHSVKENACIAKIDHIG